MLLAEENGLSTCAQEYWSVRHKSVSTFVGAPDNEMLFCGLAIGHADKAAPINSLRSERMPLSEWATFVQWVKVSFGSRFEASSKTSAMNHVSSETSRTSRPQGSWVLYENNEVRPCFSFDNGYRCLGDVELVGDTEKAVCQCPANIDCCSINSCCCEIKCTLQGM